MQKAVDVEYTVEKYGVTARRHEKAVLTDEHPASSYKIPCLLFRGEPFGVADLALNGITKIKVLWKKARTGPVWNLIQGAINAGYPIELDLSHW